MKATTKKPPKRPDHFGRYSIQRELASGGMAAVYIAQDPVLLRPVAVKVLHDKLNARDAYVQRFFQEARTVAQLQSPNIVEVYDFGEEDGTQFLVMEFVDGLSMQGVLDSLLPDRMDPIVAAALICQAAEGLLAASRRGVVHRDIKPANLLISPNGYLKIADFGISHLKDQTQTRTGAIVGSASYMSPEQANGEKGITFQSDMFSLGSVFYKCLSGSEAFFTETYAGTLRQIVDGHPLPLHRIVPDLDPELLRIVDTLLQKDPNKRGGGAAWLKAQLREYLLKKRIADPSEKIRHYLADLAGRGIQTTGFISPILIASAEMALENGAPRGRRRRARKFSGLKLVAASVVALGPIAFGIWWKTTRSGPVETAPLPARSAVLATEPPPSTQEKPAPPAEVVPAREPTPPAVPRKPREKRHLGLGSSPGLPPRSAAAEASIEPENAFLTLNTAPPFSEVTIDGTPAGTAPLNRIALTAGPHHLVVEAPQVNARLDTLLKLTPGETNLKLRIPGPSSDR